MASTMASSDSRLIEKPSASIMMKAPISDSGMATIGMITLLSEPRNANTTSITISSVSVMVDWTSAIAAVTNFEES